MGIYYYKLFDLLNRRGMKKGDLMEIAGISNATMAKLSKHKVVQTDIIDRVCFALNCQPGDIMEFVETEDAADQKS
ncbi:MAG: helix-turn-helix domain-containing protein [Christensenellales bacterium]